MCLIDPVNDLPSSLLSVFLLCCSHCDFRPLAADQMADHLLMNPEHHSATCHTRSKRHTHTRRFSIYSPRLQPLLLFLVEPLGGLLRTRCQLWAWFDCEGQQENHHRGTKWVFFRDCPLTNSVEQCLLRCFPEANVASSVVVC